MFEFARRRTVSSSNELESEGRSGKRIKFPSNSGEGEELNRLMEGWRRGSPLVNEIIGGEKVWKAVDGG